MKGYLTHKKMSFPSSFLGLSSFLSHLHFFGLTSSFCLSSSFLVHLPFWGSLSFWCHLHLCAYLHFWVIFIFGVFFIVEVVFILGVIFILWSECGITQLSLFLLLKQICWLCYTHQQYINLRWQTDTRIFTDLDMLTTAALHAVVVKNKIWMLMLNTVVRLLNEPLQLPMDYNKLRTNDFCC